MSVLRCDLCDEYGEATQLFVIDEEDQTVVHAMTIGTTCCMTKGSPNGSSFQLYDEEYVSELTRESRNDIEAAERAKIAAEKERDVLRATVAKIVSSAKVVADLLRGKPPEGEPA